MQEALNHAMHMATLKGCEPDLDQVQFTLMNQKELSRYIKEQRRKLKDV